MPALAHTTSANVSPQRPEQNTVSAPASPAIRHGARLLRARLDQLSERTGVVLGCGRGDEVVCLQRELPSCCLVGLDVALKFSPAARAGARLLRADAMQLPFRSASFDFAVSIHSLEHVRDPRAALAEIQRVLRPGGWFYLGVPNRHRLLGYLGSFDATLWQKLVWNLQDYGQRLRGRFRNECGAHAGFTSQKLRQLLSAYFANVQLLTEDYVRSKYEGRLPRQVLRVLLMPKIMEYSVPAHYALCQKL